MSARLSNDSFTLQMSAILPYREMFSVYEKKIITQAIKNMFKSIM